MKKFAALILALLSSCNSGVTIKSTSEGNGQVTLVVSHGGWTLIKAVGPKTPAPQAADITSVSASVTLSWADASTTTGAVTSYNLYRSTSSLGQNFSSPIATGISTSAKSYTDTNVVAGTTYYYILGAVVNGKVERINPVTNVDAEVKVTVPPANMVLLHRWSANREMCLLMGKLPDRGNNYRCVTRTGANAPPSTNNSGFYDIGRSIFIDAYELGCNYTATNACTDATVNGGAASACIGIRSTPNALVTAAAGSIYYSRRSWTCYVNTSVGSGTTWTQINLASTAQRQLSASSAPGLPPLTNLSQTAAADACSGVAVVGARFTYKRLIRRNEQLIAAQWTSTYSESEITTYESGASLDTTGYCNTARSLPQGNNSTDLSATNPLVAYDNAIFPSVTSGSVNNRDTLPSCRNGDCNSTTAGLLRTLRTGSNATRNCVSKFGTQDMIGNIWEYTSDQISCNGATCSGVPASSNTVDSSNDDFSGIQFDGTQGTFASTSYSTIGRIQFPSGIAIGSSSFGGDGVITPTSGWFQGANQFGSYSVGNRAIVTGGGSANGTGCGVYMISYSVPITGAVGIAADNGARCAVDAE